MQVKTPIFATWAWRPFVLVLAEKSMTPAAPVIPTQADYRGDAEWERFRAAANVIAASPRPHVLRSIGRLLLRRRSWRSWGFVWIDEDYRPRRLTPFFPPTLPFCWRIFRYGVGKTLRFLGLRHDRPAAIETAQAPKDRSAGP
jgi:hypothetical protein